MILKVIQLCLNLIVIKKIRKKRKIITIKNKQYMRRIKMIKNKHNNHIGNKKAKNRFSKKENQ